MGRTLSRFWPGALLLAACLPGWASGDDGPVPARDEVPTSLAPIRDGATARAAAGGSEALPVAPDELSHRRALLDGMLTGVSRRPWLDPSRRPGSISQQRGGLTGDATTLRDPLPRLPLSLLERWPFGGGTVGPASLRDPAVSRAGLAIEPEVPAISSLAVPILSGRSAEAAAVIRAQSPAVPRPWRTEAIARFGWWGGGFTGSPTKVGEYQGLATSPFFDVDTINSNGRSTIDLWVSGLNSDAYDLYSYVYRDGFKARVDYEQFPHRLLHDLSVGGKPESDNQVVSEDLNVGEDYAVRVRQVDARFSGPLTEHLSWKVNVFVFHKFGERQANAMAHCFNMNLVGGPADNRCHVLSQSQRIDWLTAQVEPGVVAKFNRVTLDYARTMRSFDQSDQVVYAPYTNFGAFGANGLTYFPYALVPNATFQMDRLKVGVDFTRTLRLYSYLYDGNMGNDSRQTDRKFGGFDTRLIKTYPSGVTATAYAKYNLTRNELPPFLLPEEQDMKDQIWHPIDYSRFWGGLDGQWYPFRNAGTMWRGLSFRAGYEYHEIDRDYATYPLTIQEGYVKPSTVTVATVTGNSFTQPTTRSNSFTVAQRMRWSTGVITYAKYQMRLSENPLYGVQTNSGVLNSNLPTNDQTIELGGSWAPRSNLLLSARGEFQTMWLNSPYADFAEQNYPLLFTVWYAPTPKLSFSGGYSYFSNWVNQDVTFGYRGLEEPPPAETLRVGFDGETQIVNVGARYAWTERLLVSGGIFWVDGVNTWSVPSSQTGANWSQMPVYSDVRAQSVRFQAGFDYAMTPRTGCYFRVNTFDYQDQTKGLTSGAAYFFLAGVSSVF